MNDHPITDMALYKMCRETYLQYQAQHTHNFSDSLSQLHQDVESYLQMAVDEFDSEIIVTFVLKRSDLDA